MGYTDSLIGQVVGNYHILKELGRGGMGVVYKAHETSLNRIVALKVLPRHLAQDPAFVKRFLREARAAASLNHPNIVTVYAVGEHNGIYFIAMEYVKGMALADLIRRKGQLEVREALNITLQAAWALKEAHKSEIIHRDVKPQNIMVDRAGRVKVMDFGLAKVLYGSTALTADGAILGTPRYMSPEQCQDENLDARTDIYSLGVVLYEMLCGCPPFDADSPMQLMLKIVQKPFPRLRDVNSDVPPTVAEIVACMTAKDPRARYPSAESLVADLRAVQKGVPPPFAHRMAAARPVSPDDEETLPLGEAPASQQTTQPAGPTPRSAAASQRQGARAESAASATTALKPDRAAPPEPPVAASQKTRWFVQAILTITVVAAAALVTVFMPWDSLFGQAQDSPPPQEQRAVSSQGVEGARQAAIALAKRVADRRAELEAAIDNAKDHGAERWARETYAEAAATALRAEDASDGETQVKLLEKAAALYQQAGEEADKNGLSYCQLARSNAESEKALADIAVVQAYAKEELALADGHMTDALNAGADYETAKALFEKAATGYGDARRMAGERRDKKKAERDAVQKRAHEVRGLIGSDERRLAVTKALAGDKAWDAAVAAGLDYEKATELFREAFEAYSAAIERTREQQRADAETQTPTAGPAHKTPQEQAQLAAAQQQALAKARDAATKARDAIGDLERRYAPKFTAAADNAWQAATKQGVRPTDAERLFEQARESYEDAAREAAYVAGQVRAGNIDILLYKGLTAEHRAESARRRSKSSQDKIMIEKYVDLGL